MQTLSRYNNIERTLPIPMEDLSNVIFQNDVYALNNISNSYSKIKVSTETFKYCENLGFSEIHIVKSESKKIKNFIFGNSASL